MKPWLAALLLTAGVPICATPLPDSCRLLPEMHEDGAIDAGTLTPPAQEDADLQKAQQKWDAMPPKLQKAVKQQCDDELQTVDSSSN